MRQKLILASLATLVSLAIPSISAPPDIGDNTLFQCVEEETFFDPKSCSGKLEWVSDRNGEDKGLVSVGTRKSRRLLKRWARFFKKQSRKSRKAGDDLMAEEFENKRLNAKESFRDVKSCARYESVCSANTDNAADIAFPSILEACNLIADPNNYGALNFTNQRLKFIVNGITCQASANSPVLKITRDGSQHCTGTLIAQDVVLTAAHCIPRDCFSLQVENASSDQIVDVLGCAAHPDFRNFDNLEPQAHDVALLFLYRDFKDVLMNFQPFVLSFS